MGLLGLVVAGATMSAQASFTDPFNIDSSGNAPAGGTINIASYWKLTASGTGAADLARAPGGSGTAQNFNLTPMAASTLARFYMAVPSTPTFPGMFGYNVTFTSSATLKAGESAYYKIGSAGVNQYFVTGLPQIFNITVRTNQAFEFGFQSGSSGDMAPLNISGFTATAVPEPATMVLNGLVLAGAAAGWAWNRRRKAA